MIRAISRFAALSAVLLTAGVALADEQVLYWMVNDSAEVSLDDGSTILSIGDYFSRYQTDENSGFAARIRVEGGNITEPTYLGLYFIDPDTGAIAVDSGEIGVEFGSVGGYWGAGVPTGNQSPSGDYSNGNPEYTFIVELGNISWAEGDTKWVETIAESGERGYSDLYQSGFIHPTFDLNPPAGGIWTEMQFNEVPEPSGGLLFIVGGALLALRRKRRSA